MRSMIPKAQRQRRPPKNAALTVGKKVKGRKRHIVTDVMGNLLSVVVHAANIHDTKSGIHPARQAVRRYPTLKKFCADAGYRKTFKMEVAAELGLGEDISKRIKPEWEVLLKLIGNPATGNGTVEQLVFFGKRMMLGFLSRQP